MYSLDHTYPQFTYKKYKTVDKLLFRSDQPLYYSHSDLLNDRPCG
ncbi:hypothetical protein SAMN05421840_11822 [Shewanella morhuae]|uniref:Uncharacterized protein n=1 Tax=Shewanella morhuae TaxID=365591 RepID=A0A1N7AFL2_9GAMM|nr:hypothetical protein SAMN05421840_11822 [Shewanella morhuae]SUI89928.1 Uncharacterised protein [Shewanella morhuae]